MLGYLSNIMPIRNFYFSLTLLMLSLSTIADINEHTLVFIEPDSNRWDSDRTIEDNKIIYNYSTKLKPTKEIAILIKKADYKNVTNKEVVAEFIGRLPSNTKIGAVTKWYGIQENGIQFKFSIPSKTDSLYAIAFLAYKSGYMYNIVVSKFCCSVSDDVELKYYISGMRIN